MSAHPSLTAHSHEFRKDVVELAPNVYTAVGYAASNVHFLVGADSVVVIDTTETTKAAENIFAELRRITDLPVQTIIYTHSHRDHISGASVFAGDGNPEIIASHLFSSDLVNVDNSRPGPGKALMDRTRRQFGMGLSFPDERVNLGCGPGDRPMEGMGAGFLPPTLLIEDERMKLQRSGFDLELVHAPGETPDHLVVWLADQGILICGDNFYKSFPNLYAIRGTPYRDFDAWANTLDLLKGFEAEILAPGHSRPVRGKEAVEEVLSDYRDAIRHVIAETAAGINGGRSPDELAHTVTLPDQLASKPHLTEFYGKVAWAVRAYFSGTLGWFDGNPTNLNRMAPRDEADRIIRLAGGSDRVLKAAQDALADGDLQWSLELSDRLIVAGQAAEEARALKIEGLRRLADQEINATARNYYLVYAKELDEQAREG